MTSTRPFSRPTWGQQLEDILAVAGIRPGEGRPGGQRNNQMYRCPLHLEAHGRSLSVNWQDGTWYCFGKCSRGGGVKELRELMGQGRVARYDEMPSVVGPRREPRRHDASPGTPPWEPRPVWQLVAEYLYRDRDGKVLARKRRFRDTEGNKDFRWDQPGYEGQGWVWGRKGVTPTLYNLHLLGEYPERPVALVEGEKDADRITRESGGAIIGVSMPDGAKGTWTRGYQDAAQALSGRDVVIIPDHDEAGKGHAEAALRELLLIARSVKSLWLTALDTGDVSRKDISDYFDMGNRWDWLEAIIADAPEIRARPAPSEAPPFDGGPVPASAATAFQVMRAKRRAILSWLRRRARKGKKKAREDVTGNELFARYILTVNLEDMSRALPPAERQRLVGMVFGEQEWSRREMTMVESVRYLKASYCGFWAVRACPKHGPQEKADRAYTCGERWCPWCESEVAAKVSRLYMPDLAGQQYYRSVWLTSKVSIPHEIGALASTRVEDAVDAECNKWLAALERLGHRRAMQGAGKILCRGSTWEMRYPKATVRWKLILQEDEPGEMDWLVEELCQIMGAHIQEPAHDYCTQDAEVMMVQAMENLNQTLLNVTGSSAERVVLFEGFTSATRHRHLLETMGQLRDAKETQWPVIKAQMVEQDKGPRRCKQKEPDGTACGIILRLVPDKPGPDWEETPDEVMADGPPPPVGGV